MYFSHKRNVESMNENAMNLESNRIELNQIEFEFEMNRIEYI